VVRNGPVAPRSERSSQYRHDEMSSMIVKDQQRAVMEFIATVNRGGYRPTGREINEWRLRPDPRPRRQGKLLEAAVPEIPERRVRKGPSWLESMVGSGLLAEVKRNQNVLDAFSKSYLSSINRTLDVVGKSHMSTIRNLGAEPDYEIIPGRPGRASTIRAGQAGREVSGASATAALDRA
jgi:hypothetical protein